jgi:hypothetical protein
MVSLTLWPLYQWGKYPRFSLRRRLGGIQSRSGRRKSNPGRPAHSLITVLTELSWPTLYAKMIINSELVRLDRKRMWSGSRELRCVNEKIPFWMVCVPPKLGALYLPNISQSCYSCINLLSVGKRGGKKSFKLIVINMRKENNSSFPL